MSKIDKAFGFYPKHLQVATGPISIRPLPELDEYVQALLSSDTVDNGWIYARPQQTRDFVSGEIKKRSYNPRVFSLPKTHMFKHAKATGEDHIEFHLWALSFFLGMRLTATDPGYLDATPIKSGSLVDFVLLGKSLEQAIELAEQFWMANQGKLSNVQRFEAAVHALFLSQYPQALQFEQFIQLYMAIDACYALTKELQCPTAKQIKHYQRIEWMCGELGVMTPSWAHTAGGSGTMVSVLRNNTLHEALYVGEPLGFAIRGGNASENITLEMNTLICRLLVALLGGKDSSYISSPVNSRQRYGLSLI